MKLFNWIVVGCLITLTHAKAEQQEGYKLPSKAIADVVDAKLAPSTRLSPNNKWMAFFERQRIATLKELSKPELKLAGIQLNPKNFSRSRPYSKYLSISFKHLKTGKKINITGLPDGRILSPSWSPNSEYLAFFIEQAEQANLYLFNIAAQKLTQVKSVALNSVITSMPYRWLPNSTGVLVNVVANINKDAPTAESAPVVPVISQTSGEKAPVRTYQNLLQTPLDKSLFEFYGLSRLAKVSLKGEVTYLTGPGIISSFRASPNSEYILLGQIEAPFSYLVPYSRFAKDWQVITMDGKVIANIAKQKLAEDIPQGFDSVRTDKRSFSWRSDKPATLVWAQAQDGGSMKEDVPYHDHVYTWKAPFKSEAKLFAKVERRFSGIEWANDNVAILSDWRFSDRQVRMQIINPNDPDGPRVLFNERSYNDAYKDPGDFVYGLSEYGTRIVKVVGERYMHLTGIGASNKGNIPFLDRFDIKTGSSTRIWQSESPYYERVRAVLDGNAEKLVTLRESKTEQPNFYLRDLKQNSLEKFTDFAHPYPQFKNIKKEQINYTRDDGVSLSGTLYLPANYEGGKVPVLMWAYPLEYKDKDVASQVRDSPYEFTYIGYWGPMPYLANGIAVFDDPKMPIVGVDGKEPNDTFRKQLVSSAEAAVNVLVDKGIADKSRIAIAGHSYGAFMVANLLAHSDLFKTGIARSGAYNRTLTPFGFQGEERDFWQGQSVYASMSPFFHAEKINEPMLMIHGKEDPNSGTYPMQSERMYNALKGLGKEARLVMLPYEGHGYRARESILHVLWEQEQWLNKTLLTND
ncbi:alpha/beta hydrolase family protein [Pseudoalteromonas sp. G4]|uniref:alpha/beta hydrolase family protein n=1 Tax=Pseudoalteromonas sp. G4 TaxID=2992761 RepID=UPI00237E203F|nr:prolyl oligopeptidase family serine peptidase [Pseudoalteromonas sp. G4]MDE3271473.1 prolyl oligopeptidase family serine peptidase [Pseudoalteromonas sp. G4]